MGRRTSERRSWRPSLGDRAKYAPGSVATWQSHRGSSQCYRQRGTCGKGEDCQSFKAMSTPRYQAVCAVHRETNV